MNLRKRGLALLMCICMVFTLLPFSVFAENDTGADTGSAAQVPDGKAKIGDTVYDTLEAAVNAAPSDATATTTIYLGAGNYTLYNKGATTSNKNLTFVGQGTDETTWLIGPKVPNPANLVRSTTATTALTDAERRMFWKLSHSKI